MLDLQLEDTTGWQALKSCAHHPLKVLGMKGSSKITRDTKGLMITIESDCVQEEVVPNQALESSQTWRKIYSL